MAKPPYRALGVALRIFSVLLAVVLGTIRTLWIAPRLGTRMAEKA